MIPLDISIPTWYTKNIPKWYIIKRSVIMFEKIMKILFIVGIILFVIVFILSKNDPVTSYYYDANKNGKEDFGEGVWYEDKNGVHFYD